MTLNLCVVGLGSAGYQHIQALKDINEINVTSFFDTDNSKYIDGLRKIHSWAEVLSDESIHAVALCVPPGNRFKLVSEVLASGKSVLIEKPPFMNIKELEATVELAKKYNNTVGVMFQHRYQLPIEVYNLLINSKTTAVLEISRPREQNRYFKDWRTDPTLSFGGVTAHLGVHYLDLTLQIMGKPKNISTFNKSEFSPGIDKRFSGAIEFENGSSLIFSITSEAFHRSERLKIFTEDSTLTIQNSHILLDIQEKETEFKLKSTNELRSLLYTDFASAVVNNSEPQICNLERSRHITWLLEEIYNV